MSKNLDDIVFVAEQAMDGKTKHYQTTNERLVNHAHTFDNYTFFVYESVEGIAESFDKNDPMLAQGLREFHNLFRGESLVHIIDDDTVEDGKWETVATIALENRRIEWAYSVCRHDMRRFEVFDDENEWQTEVTKTNF